MGSQWILAYVGRRHIGSTYEEDIEVESTFSRSPLWLFVPMFKGRIGCSARRAFDSSMQAFLQMTQDLTRELIKEVKRSEQINKDMRTKTKRKIPLQNSTGSSGTTPSTDGCKI